MIEWFTRHCITAIVLGLILLGIVVCLWEAIPGIIKIILAIVVVSSFVRTIKS